MKKWMIWVVALLACCQKNEMEIKVAATAEPHAQMLYQIVPDMKEAGITLTVIEVDDYCLPNRLLAEGQVEANFFQHQPFLQAQQPQLPCPLEVLAAIHLEPMGLYSDKIKDLKDLPCGSRIAVPSDPTNYNRALLLLEQAQLIRLEKSEEFTLNNLTLLDNPLQLKLCELDAPFLARALPDVALAAIPANVALQANLSPQDEAIFLEPIDSVYANVLVARAGNQQEGLLWLKKYMTSDKMKHFILEHYKGAILPAF
jgi:D-methionine transport system substrate-binding protein